MTVRDAGMVALGFLAGMLAASVSIVTIAREQDQTDRLIRALTAKFGDPRVTGKG